MSEKTKKARIIELKPNIYLVLGVKPSSHVYLIKGLERNLLIDSGMVDNFDNLKTCLAEVGLGIDDIDLVILTHEHFDHIGATTLFYDKVMVAAHHYAANKIQLQDEFVLMNKYFQENSKPIRADIWLEDGTVIDLGNYKLKVIHTPGHCSGSICLYEAEHKILFTGDTVLAGGIFSEICPSGSISDYLNSLQNLKALNIEAMYPGHGRISTSPGEDMALVVERAQTLMEESKILFETLDTKNTFDQLFFALRKFKLPPKAAADLQAAEGKQQ